MNSYRRGKKRERDNDFDEAGADHALEGDASAQQFQLATGLKSPDKPSVPGAKKFSGFAAQFISTTRRVGSALKAVLTKAATWWTSRAPLDAALPAELPKDPERALRILRREQAAIAEAEVQCDKDLESQRVYHQQMEKRSAELLERFRTEEEKQQYLRISLSEQRDAEEMLAQRELTDINRRMDQSEAVIRKYEERERQSDVSKARSNRTEKAAQRREGKSKPHEAEWIRETVRNRMEILVREAQVDIPWVDEPAFLGVRQNPDAMFQEPIPCPSPHASIVAAGGHLSAIDWSDHKRYPSGQSGDCKAIETAANILYARVQRVGKVGRPIKHIAHGVLAKPFNPKTGEPVDPWTGQSATRAARHYLVGLGADPDRHDWVAVLHRQSKKGGNGEWKVEEAIHVLWSRVRDDGALHHCAYSFVASALSRARWDSAAGLDVGRVSMTHSESGRDIWWSRGHNNWW